MHQLMQRPLRLNYWAKLDFQCVKTIVKQHLPKRQKNYGFKKMKYSFAWR
jgi:hypothetical protein